MISKKRPYIDVLDISDSSHMVSEWSSLNVCSRRQLIVDEFNLKHSQYGVCFVIADSFVLYLSDEFTCREGNKVLSFISPSSLRKATFVSAFDCWRKTFMRVIVESIAVTGCTQVPPLILPPVVKATMFGTVSDRVGNLSRQLVTRYNNSKQRMRYGICEFVPETDSRQKNGYFLIKLNDFNRTHDGKNTFTFSSPCANSKSNFDESYETFMSGLRKAYSLKVKKIDKEKDRKEERIVEQCACDELCKLKARVAFLESRLGV
jgi:hypothetical protein